MRAKRNERIAPHLSAQVLSAANEILCLIEMNCPKCGMFIPDGSATCHYCGSPVAPQYPAAPQYQQAPAAPYGYNPQMAAYPTAGYQQAYAMPQPMMAYPMYPMMKPRTGTPVAAGAMLLIGGILAMLAGTITLMAGAAISALLGTGLFMICGAVQLVFGILAMVGGICAIQRKVWALALVGSIFGMMSIGFVGEASILGLISLILVIISKDEFT